MSSAKRNGSAWSTAVASGVRFRNLKALGPENACPMVMIIYYGKPHQCSTVEAVLVVESKYFRSF